MEVRIYRPSRVATQSGQARTHDWVLEFEPSGRTEIDSLMGWTGSGDTREQVQLRFATKEDAVAYARKHGHTYTVDEPQARIVRPKSYAENFTRPR
jgi:hypothetical protein